MLKKNILLMLLVIQNITGNIKNNENYSQNSSRLCKKHVNVTRCICK